MSEASSGPAIGRSRGYQQRIERCRNSSMYVRIDTGLNLEEAWLCVEDGEPDTHRVAKFVSIAYADAFVHAWNTRVPLSPDTQEGRE